MAQKLNISILNKVKQYKKLLQEKIPVEKVIVFGSQVKGTAKSYSDIDVAVISRIFGKDRHDEGVLLSRFVDGIDVRIEPHPYHPTDLKDKWDALACEINKYGIIVG